MKSSKSPFSQAVRWFRENYKRCITYAAGKLLGLRSFTIFGVPSGLSSQESERNTKIQIYPPERLSLAEPRSIETKLYWKFQAILQGMEVPEEGLLMIPQGIATSKGGTLTERGKLITTFLQAIDGKPPHRHDLFLLSSKRFFPTIYQSAHPVVTLTTGWQGAFYHWVYEVLPRMHLAEKAGHSHDMYYAESIAPFQKESLALLGLDSSRLINAKEFPAVRAPQIYLPSIPETPTVWGCQFLREKFLPKLEKKSPLRLYVSRNDASRRRILNEEEVFALLKKYGFQKYQLTSLNFKEQAELFQAAEVVVGPHGAGFSHLVFCKPSTPVLEIFSPAYVNPCYWHVADRVGLNYFYLFGEGARFPDYTDPRMDPDIVVNLKELEASLHLMDL